MNSPKDILTSRQLLVILISTVIGVQVFIMPRLVVEAAGRDGWLSLVLGGGWALLAATAAAYLASLFPRQTPVVWFSHLLGKWGGIALSLGFGCFFLFVAAEVLRLFTDMTQTYLLPRTPSEIIMITFLLSIAYVVCHGINPIARVTLIFFLFGIIPSIILIAVFQGKVNFGELVPVLAGGIAPVIRGFLPAYGDFGGWGIIVFLVQFMDTPKEAVKGTAVGMAVIWLFFMATFIITLAAFGPIETQYLLYPVVDLIREMEGVGGFIEKLDLIFLSAWILSVFVTLAVCYYVAVLAISQLAGIKNIAVPVYVGLPLVYLLALLPQGYKAAEGLAGYLNYTSFIFSLSVPLLVFLARRKIKQGGVSDGDQT